MAISRWVPAAHKDIYFCEIAALYPAIVHYQSKIQLKENIKSYSAPLSDLLRSARPPPLW